MPAESEKLQGLDPLFGDKVRKVVADLEFKGWKIRIVWGKRSHEENMALVKKGYASRNSKHLTGHAVDLVDRNTGYSNDRSHQYYRDLENSAKRNGLLWGGNFSARWDPCHIEMP